MAWQALKPDAVEAEALKQADIEEKLEQEDQAWFNAHHDEIFETLFPDPTVPEHAPWSFRFLAAPSFPNIPRMDLMIWTDSKGMAWIRYRAPFAVGIMPQISGMRRTDPALTMEKVKETFMKEELTLSLEDWPELRERIRSIQKVEIAPQSSDPFTVTVMVDGAGYQIEIRDAFQNETFNLGSGQYGFSDLESPDPSWRSEHPLIKWAQSLLVEMHRRWLKRELSQSFPDIPSSSLKLFRQELLMAAISEKNAEWTRWMLNLGAKANSRDELGRTPLGAVRDWEKTLKPGDPDPYTAILNLLIKAGAKE